MVEQLVFQTHILFSVVQRNGVLFAVQAIGLENPLCIHVVVQGGFLTVQGDRVWDFDALGVLQIFVIKSKSSGTSSAFSLLLDAIFLGNSRAGYGTSQFVSSLALGAVILIVLSAIEHFCGLRARVLHQEAVVVGRTVFAGIGEVISILCTVGYDDAFLTSSILDVESVLALDADVFVAVLNAVGNRPQVADIVQKVVPVIAGLAGGHLHRRGQLSMHSTIVDCRETLHSISRDDEVRLAFRTSLLCGPVGLAVLYLFSPRNTSLVLQEEIGFTFNALGEGLRAVVGLAVLCGNDCDTLIVLQEEGVLALTAIEVEVVLDTERDGGNGVRNAEQVLVQIEVLLAGETGGGVSGLLAILHVDLLTDVGLGVSSLVQFVVVIQIIAYNRLGVLIEEVIGGEVVIDHVALFAYLTLDLGELVAKLLGGLQLAVLLVPAQDVVHSALLAGVFGGVNFTVHYCNFHWRTFSVFQEKKRKTLETGLARGVNLAVLD